MKKQNMLCLLLTLLCCAVLVVYMIQDRVISDTVPPEIHIPDGIHELSVTASDTEMLAGLTATDKKDGDVTHSMLVESMQIVDSREGLVTIRVAAFDSQGNVSKAQRQLRFTDYQKPRFSLNSPLVYNQLSSMDVLRDVSAADLLDGDVTNHIRMTSLSDDSITALGVHEVELRVTNSIGDSTQLVIPVEVLQSGIYDATLNLKEYLVYLDQGAVFRPDDYLKSFVLNREETSLSSGLPNGFSLNTTGHVDTDTPGTYIVTYKVDLAAPSLLSNGNERVYTGYSKLIVVVEG